ncbi:MAG TPA: hypothetical protein VFV75_05530 [Candidatus Polarisedimenticolaceae bacterium]|nr:hypothetical protein [Candidatus Polarisedimenticolaceae bacterium]
MRARTWCLVAAACVALLAAFPASAAEEVGIAIDPQEPADTCLDYTPVEGAQLEPALLLGIEGEAVAPKPKPCRQACPDQPWCECTYQGQPRISCDPCCYQTYYGVICTS